MTNNEKRIYNAFSPNTKSVIQVELRGSLNRVAQKFNIRDFEFEFVRKKNLMVFMYLTLFLFAYFVGLKATL